MKRMHIAPIIEAKHVDSYLLGPLLAVLFMEPVADAPEQFHYILYIYRPDPQSPPSPGNPPPRIMTLLTLTTDVGEHMMRVITEAGISDSMVPDALLELDRFIEYGLALVARRYNIRLEPVLLPMPNADAPFGGVG